MESSADDFFDRRREEIAKRMHHRRDASKRFMTEEVQRQIWTAGSNMTKIAVFLKLNLDELGIVERDLLQTLTILVKIGWRNWGRFKDIFLHHQTANGERDRTDRAICDYTFEGLVSPSFLDSEDKAISFLDTRPSFQPLIIEEGQVMIRDKGTKLPFQEENKVIGHGSYGEVTKEVIAPRQFLQGKDSDNKGPKAVACKTFIVKEDFEKEMENLEILRDALAEHNRVAKFLAIISIGPEFSILSPLATMDLNVFLYNTSPDFDEKFTITLENMVEEARNLVDALHHLHDEIKIPKIGHIPCYHMDLKPANILVYQADAENPVGKWKISDFGISLMDRNFNVSMRKGRGKEIEGWSMSGAKYLHVPTVSALVTKTTKIAPDRGTGTWQGPEVRSSEDKVLGNKSDIWSYGCIFTQVMARGLEGVGGLRILDEQRKMPEDGAEGADDTFYRGQRGAERLNPSVKDWINCLENKGASDGSRVGPRYLRNCGYLIRLILRINPEERLSATEIYNVLKSIDSKNISAWLTSRLQHLPRHLVHKDPRISESFNDPISTDEMASIDIKSSLQGSCYGLQRHGSPAAGPSISVSPPVNPGEESLSTPSLFMYSPPQISKPQPENHGEDEACASTTLPWNGESRKTSRRSNDDFVHPTTAHNSIRGTIFEEPVSIRASRNQGHQRSATVDEFPKPRSHPGSRLSLPTPPRTSPSILSPNSDPMLVTAPALEVQLTTPRDSIESMENYHEITSVGGGSTRPQSLYSITSSPSKSNVLTFDVPKGSKYGIISTCRHKVAFIAEETIVVYIMTNFRSKLEIDAPRGVKWFNASLSGMLLLARGQKIESSNSSIFYLYRLGEDPGGTLNYTQFQVWDIPEKPYLDGALSRHGHILFDSSNSVTLVTLFRPRGQMPILPLNLKVEGFTRRCWFGSEGDWIFAWSIEGQTHYINAWNVKDVEMHRKYRYQVPYEHNHGDPVPGVFSFPKTSECIIWKQNDNVSMLDQKDSRSWNLSGLKALTVAPDGEGIIYIRKRSKLSRTYEIFKSTITLNEDDQVTIRENGPGIKLKIPLEVDKHYNIVVENLVGHETRVFIAHPNGKIEELTL